MTILIDTSNSMLSHIGMAALSQHATLLNKLGHGPVYATVSRGLGEGGVEELPDPNRTIDLSDDNFGYGTPMKSAVEELIETTSDNEIIIITDCLFDKTHEFIEFYNNTSQDLSFIHVGHHDTDFLNAIPEEDYTFMRT